jgi:uncharacterized RDD family membrane protein YckC
MSSEISQTTDGAKDYRYASIPKRSLAFLIDSLVGIPVGLLVFFVFGEAITNERWIGATIFAPVFIIKTISQYRNGQSIGQRIMKVTLKSDSKLTIFRVAARNAIAFFILLIPTLNVIHVIGIRISKERQGLHDLAGKTFVIRTD